MVERKKRGRRLKRLSDSVVKKKATKAHINKLQRANYKKRVARKLADSQGDITSDTITKALSDLVSVPESGVIDQKLPVTDTPKTPAKRKAVTKPIWAKEFNLSPKQIRFIKEYVRDFNGRQTAIRLGIAPESADNHYYSMKRTQGFNEAIAYILFESVDAKTFVGERLMAIAGQSDSEVNQLSALDKLAKATKLYESNDQKTQVKILVQGDTLSVC